VNALLQTGHIVDGRYEVLRFIGEGGMQYVYESRDQVIGRLVALKTPNNRSPPPSQIGERGRYEVVVRCHQAHRNRGPGDRERPVWRRWTGGLAEVIAKRLPDREHSRFPAAMRVPSGEAYRTSATRR
jgi:serine/threonine protein kinase